MTRPPARTAALTHLHPPRPDLPEQSSRRSRRRRKRGQLRRRTRAAWLDLPAGCAAALREHGLGLDAGLHAAAHAVLASLPLHLSCEPSDVGCECGALRKGSLWPKRLLLFDRCEGGIGIARRAHAHMAPLLRTALELMRSCPACRDGCVLCVHTSQCPEYNAGTDKRATVAIVERRPTLAEVAGAAAAVFTCCSFQCVCVFQAYSSTWQRPRPRLPFRSPMPGGLGPLELIVKRGSLLQQ